MVRVREGDTCFFQSASLIRIMKSAADIGGTLLCVLSGTDTCCFSMPRHRLCPRCSLALAQFFSHPNLLRVRRLVLSIVLAVLLRQAAFR